MFYPRGERFYQYTFQEEEIEEKSEKSQEIWIETRINTDYINRLSLMSDILPCTLSVITKSVL